MHERCAENQGFHNRRQSSGRRHYLSLLRQRGRIVDANPGKDTGFFWFPESKGGTAIWDLSEVAPGTYKITAAVDNGCGPCGKTETKEVRVLACQKSTQF